jgi:prefoldin subunit 5
MKLENYDRVVAIVEKIRRKQSVLDALSSGRVTVIINSNEQSGHIMTVGADIHYEHDYTLYAVQFIASVKKDLEQHISVLNSELESL